VIEISRLTKRFQDRTVLDNITVSFAKGETVALIGPSGGGKSTLLRCLNGLESFDEGQVRIGADAVGPGGFKHNKQALFSIRQRLGFVFQQWNLFAHRTALGNVIEAPVMVKNIPQYEAVEKARALLNRVGLSHREYAYPHEMSGGEQQRVAIARALAMEPEGLLMDEPTSALDPERVGDVLELMEKLTGDGLTMLVVTHEMKFARNAASRVLVLHGGRILEDGPPAEVLDHPKHERTRAFLGLDDAPAVPIAAAR
jgi:polar amino acid transport system ATP-binding protein